MALIYIRPNPSQTQPALSFTRGVFWKEIFQTFYRLRPSRLCDAGLALRGLWGAWELLEQARDLWEGPLIDTHAVNVHAAVLPWRKDQGLRRGIVGTIGGSDDGPVLLMRVERGQSFFGGDAHQQWQCVLATGEQPVGVAEEKDEVTAELRWNVEGSA